MSQDTIEIAGKSVPIIAWAIGQQLAAAFASTHGTDRELKEKHELALAVHAGMMEQQRREPKLVNKIIDLQQRLDVISDELRTLARSL